MINRWTKPCRLYARNITEYEKRCDWSIHATRFEGHLPEYCVRYGRSASAIRSQTAGCCHERCFVSQRHAFRWNAACHRFSTCLTIVINVVILRRTSLVRGWVTYIGHFSDVFINIHSPVFWWHSKLYSKNAVTIPSLSSLRSGIRTRFRTRKKLHVFSFSIALFRIKTREDWSLRRPVCIITLTEICAWN